MKTVKEEVSDQLFLKLLEKKKLDGYEDAPWEEWFQGLTRGIELEQTISQSIRRGTKNLLPMWMKNFGDNLPLIRDGATLRDLVVEDTPPPPQHRAIVLGRGPSLFKKSHLKLIKEARFPGTLVATDGILLDCLREGLVPPYVLAVDGSPVIRKWFDDPLVDEHAPQITLVLNTQVNGDVAKDAISRGFKVYWFEPNQDNVKQEVSVTKILLLMTVSPKNPDGIVAMECGGNVGTTSWIFSWKILRKSDVALVGFDFGYPEDMPLSDTYYYDNTVRTLGALQTSTVYDRIWHPVFRTTSHIDVVFKSYREGFFEMLLTKPQWQRTVNATEGGTLFHPGLECMALKDWLEEEKNEIQT